LSGRFSLNGNNVVLDGTTVIGTRNANGGVGTISLVVTFNASATVARVELLLRAIRFRTVSGAGGQRQIRFRVSDGDGATSAAVVRTINVNSPPSAFPGNINDDLFASGIGDVLRSL
jgi:hypothetical protein